MKIRIISAIVAVATMLAVLPLFSAAAPIHTRRDVNLTVDGKTYLGETRLIESTTYVPLRAFCEFVTDPAISWDQPTKTATVTAWGTDITVISEGDLITAKGRYFWCRYGIINDNGTLFVPLRAIASALGYDTAWSGDTFTAELSYAGELLSGEHFYDSGALYWLSHIIHAEAGCESLLGQIAVGNVVLNRRASDGYPDTIYGVIFDMRGGPQFTPAATGSIYLEPDEESIIAAKICLEGYTISEEIEFFMNPRIATSTWISDNCTFVVRIGNHDFYR